MFEKSQVCFIHKVDKLDHASNQTARNSISQTPSEILVKSTGKGDKKKRHVLVPA